MSLADAIKNALTGATPPPPLVVPDVTPEPGDARRHCLPCDVKWTGGPWCWACGQLAAPVSY